MNSKTSDFEDFVAQAILSYAWIGAIVGVIIYFVG